MRQIDDGVMPVPAHTESTRHPKAVRTAGSPGHMVPTEVVDVLRRASQQSGVSFSFLLAQASGESGFQSRIKNHISSATGLFQFTKGTWLQMMKQHGAAHGYATLAEKIRSNGKGQYVVDDPATRKVVMDLRNDPELSAQMAAHLAKDNKATLAKALGREITPTDLYMAHFLGPSGAIKILKAHAIDPSQPAAALFPKAATHNKSIFYGPDEKPRTVAAVYDRMLHAIEKPAQQYAELIKAQEGPGTPSPAENAPVAGPDTTGGDIELASLPSAVAAFPEAIKHIDAYKLAYKLVDYISKP